VRVAATPSAFNRFSAACVSSMLSGAAPDTITRSERKSFWADAAMGADIECLATAYFSADNKLTRMVNKGKQNRWNHHRKSDAITSDHTKESIWGEIWEEDSMCAKVERVQNECNETYTNCQPKQRDRVAKNRKQQ